MVDVTVQTGLIALATGLSTLLLGDALRRWRTRAEVKKDGAALRHTDAEADQKTMEALTNAFRAISERQADDINDLRERLRRVEDALLLAHERNDKLTVENEELKADVVRLRGERDLLAGEVRQLKQLSASSVRVYGQDGTEPDDD